FVFGNPRLDPDVYVFTFDDSRGQLRDADLFEVVAHVQRLTVRMLLAHCGDGGLDGVRYITECPRMVGGVDNEWVLARENAFEKLGDHMLVSHAWAVDVVIADDHKRFVARSA